MNIHYGRSSSPGNVAPTLNLLPNSNRNDQSLSQVSSSSYVVILGFTWDRSIYNISHHLKFLLCYRVQLHQLDIVLHFIMIQEQQEV